MRAKIVGLLLLVAVGCARPAAPLKVESWREVPAPPHAQDATDVLVEVLGIKGTPQVHWYGGAGLDCSDGTGWETQTGDPDWPVACWGGQELNGVILVAYVEGQTIRQTQLAHEVTHMLGEETGDGDPDHLRHDLWWAGGVLEVALTAIDGL